MRSKLLGFMLFSVIGCSAVQLAFAGIFTASRGNIWPSADATLGPSESNYKGQHVCWHDCQENCIHVAHDIAHAAVIQGRPAPLPLKLRWIINTETGDVHCVCAAWSKEVYGENFKVQGESCVHIRHSAGYEEHLKDPQFTPPRR